jgi:hypothetical protein
LEKREEEIQAKIENTTPATRDTRIKREIFAHSSDYEAFEFILNETAKFDLYDFDVSADIMNSKDIRLLRHHNYYKGWYHCTKSNVLKELHRQSPDHETFFPDYFDEKSNP